jgi:dienelactone hydrolase
MGSRPPFPALLLSLVGLPLLPACEGSARLEVDILPGAFPNVIQPDSDALDVAVLAPPGFHPSWLDPDTAVLTDAAGTVEVRALAARPHADVNGDGRPDAVLAFSITALRDTRLLTAETSRLVLRARGRGPLQDRTGEGWDRVVLDASGAARLPAPSGPHAVGTTAFLFSDPTRPAPGGLQQPHRTLPVQAFYPAHGDPRSAAVQPAPYFLEDRQAQIHAERRRLPATFFDRAAGWARLDVRPADHPGRFPVLVFSPGLGSPIAYYQTLLADVASHGYVVLAIAHPRHAGVVVYPDGQSVAPIAGTDPVEIREVHDHAVLDQRALVSWLAAHGAPAPLRGRLDLGRRGAFGHSLGGSASADAALADPSVRVALNIDGQFFGLASGGGPPAPVMHLASEPHTETVDPSLARFVTNRRGVAYYARVAGTLHNNVQDWGLLRPLMSNPPPLPMLSLGPIDPRRGVEVIASYARALFDQHLRDRPSPLLAGPDPGFPEVVMVVHPAP